MKLLRKLAWFVLALAVLEIASRLYLFSKIPSEYRPKGLEAARTFLSGGSYLCEFRGRTYLFQKPDGVYRIVAVGGSTTAGVRGDDETWPYKLQVLLNAGASARRRYEVINIAQSGIASPQEYYYLATQQYLGADMVIVYDGYNDNVYANGDSAHYLLNSAKTYELLERNGDGSSLASALYRHSALANRFATYLHRLQTTLNETIIARKWFGLGRQGRLRMFENVEWYASRLKLGPEIEKTDGMHWKDLVKPGVPEEQKKKILAEHGFAAIDYKVGELTLKLDLLELTGQRPEKDLFPEIYRYSLDNMAKLIAKNGQKGVFVFQPFLSEKILRTTGDLKGENLSGLSNFTVESDMHFAHTSAPRKEIMREAAWKGGLSFLDAQSIFDSEDNARMYMDNCHNTDAGLDILTARIRDFLKSESLL